MMLKEQAKEQGKHWLFYAAVFFCFLAIYAATAQRGVSWQDSGEFQYRILAGDYQWNSGIARAHPLYILMARGFVALFPHKTCFYAMNLFSGVGLACALALLAGAVMRLTSSVRAAALAVCVLGFAHMAWWLGTVAEVYTWSLAFLMAEVLCLARYSEGRDGRWLVALFGVNGLHWSLHNAALLGLPVYGLLLVLEAWRRRRASAAVVIGSVAAWSLGGSMIVWQAAKLWLGAGDPAVVLKSVLFGDGYGPQVLGTAGFALDRWAANMALAAVSFLNPCWWFAGGGFVGGSEGGLRTFRTWLAALTLLHGVFWIRYFVADQATFVLPTLGLLAIAVGLGYRKLEAGKRRWNGARWAALAAAGIVLATAGPWAIGVVARRTGVDVTRARDLPFRDEMRYWLVPWKQDETSAARFVAEIGKQLRAGDVLLADATAAGPLLATRAAGTLSAEWRLITPWSGETDAALRAVVREGAPKVFAVSPVAGYLPKAVTDAARGFERQGVVYRVK